MLPVRVLTAAALLAAFLSALWFPDRTGFAALVAAFVGLGGYEWARLGKSSRFAGAAYGLACALLLLALARWGGPAPWVFAAAGAFWIVAVPAWLARGYPAGPAPLAAAAGFVVLVPAGLALARLGRGEILMLLGLVWVADSAAYFAGRAFGRRKLAPAISPAKTWEGVAGAVVATLIYAIIWANLDPAWQARLEGAAWAPYLAGTVFLCAASVLGDLFESAAKRRAGVKDSGSLLPGHGGVLDRIDSATAMLPLAMLLMHATGLK